MALISRATGSEIEAQTAPHTIVLVGAFGDLARRKLLPGLFRLDRSGYLPRYNIVGVSLEDRDHDDFRAFARSACHAVTDADAERAAIDAFVERLTYVPQGRGAAALTDAVARSEDELGDDARRLHYLSIPPTAARHVVRSLGDAELVHRARIILEKPFGTDLESARTLNSLVHEHFPEHEVFRIDHFLGKEAALNIIALRFANGLFEPIWGRNSIEHVQIDVPETASLETRSSFYESTGAFRDMVVTHLFQILAFMAMEPPTALEPHAINEEKNKVFRSMRPISTESVVRGQYRGYRDLPGVAPDSDTETFVALRCEIDNWRWAGVPFYLRTGKRMAEDARIISIAFREPVKSMFPENSGLGTMGPDHLTFDLADASRLSLSFYGKRPGPGMRLDKLSMQFALHDTDAAPYVLEAYERLILDAMNGDRTLFTSAEGIERLWEVSAPLLEGPPPTSEYAPGTWGPAEIDGLISPRSWRLPFARTWRSAR